MYMVKKDIAAVVASSIEATYPTARISREEIVWALAYPPDSAMGDIALPCFKFSKALRCAPGAIAVGLSAAFENTPYRAEAVGGYLNIFLDKSHFFRDVCAEITEKGARYGAEDTGGGRVIVLDYSSPNVAKPFHIGHLGTTVIGHSLKKLHEFAGYKCIGINHLGDWGTQIGKLIVAYRRWGCRESVEKNGVDELVALYVRFHGEAESDSVLNDEARAAFSALEQGGEEEVGLWRWFISLSIDEYKKTYRQLDIEFDYYTGESFYTDKMPAVVRELRDGGLLKTDDGASIVELEQYGMPPCLILKKDGSTLYPARDIAAAVYRKNTFDFHKCIYVTSAAQSLHFAQWFRVVELMGYDWCKDLVHVPYGTVSINGEKLATRTGNVILLRDLFNTAIEKVREIMAQKNPELARDDDTAEAVGVGAVIFYYLSSNKIRDINFIMEDALNFDGNTGPYAQYTYARCCSIISKADGASVLSQDGDICNEEFELTKTLSLFPEAVQAALREYEPSVITRYILDVCASFNRFYHNCQILGAEEPGVVARRVRLTECTKITLENAFELICMKHPSKI